MARCHLLNLFLLPVISASPANFQEFKVVFKKTYASTEEEQTRAAVFLRNFDEVQRLNELERAAQPGLVGDVYGVTAFMDLTSEEFAAQMGHAPLEHQADEYDEQRNAPIVEEARSPSSRHQPRHRPREPSTVLPQLPHKGFEDGNVLRDWCLGFSFCTAVKYQGICHSCWAFTAVEMMESMALIAGRPVPALSPQQIVDCLQSPGVCRPHHREKAWEYAKRHAIETVEDYPITSQVSGETKQCNASGNAGVLRATQISKIERHEQSMVDWLGKHGPLAIAVNVKSWQFYTGGRRAGNPNAGQAGEKFCNYISAATCGSTIDHAVQLVGYVVAADTNRVQGFRIRNSWGDGWGCDGFVYLTAGENTCKITTDPASVSVEAAAFEAFV